MTWQRLPGLDLSPTYTDPAQHLIAADPWYYVDDLDDLCDLYELYDLLYLLYELYNLQDLYDLYDLYDLDRDLS